MSIPSTKSEIMMETNPGSLASESYRSLRFNMETFALDQGIQTVSLTSAGRGEGKTTTALNVATAYAQIEKRVLLIDADLRNPSLHYTFGGDNSKGLSSYLMHQSTLDEIIAPTNIQNLSVIPAGAVPTNPAELLASKAMKQLLEEVKPRYDMIFIDSSSVLSLTDGKIVAAQCDGVLLVVDHGKLKRQAAKKVKEELELAKAKLLGVVFNKVNPKNAELFLY
ncbi:CpsD/CapB family tyrosine-protein kinase [Paenibacillus sp. UNC451MF]|uniref:CpsD/CapB family tyrosine-protein kinase n=1 Tax=Paenibacillus sp. UNC451MF TaxID=1449063 RepID=UPI00048F5C5C|nr:CpsD/CapB family tyrosine-protein kinase [Paenibacillus sp. UNC451MF]